MLRKLFGGALVAFTLPALAHAQLVVNEIDYDQSGTDSAEFIEIKNTSGSAVDLDPYALELVNGNSGDLYLTIDLPAFSLAAGDYYVVCGDAAIVDNCDLDTDPDQNLIQNGAPDAVAIVLGASIIDTVSYEGDTVAPYTEGTGTGLEDDSTIGNAGISRFPDGVDTDQNATDLSQRCSTPGAVNVVEDTGCVISGGLVEIWEIQGTGLVSPFLGQAVTTESNLVIGTSEFGFFMQTPTARTDGDDETSDGIWVFTGGPPTVTVGDLVDVDAEVTEFFDLTELENPVVTLISSGNALPAPVVFDANTPSPNQPQPENELERYEGMLVSASGVVGEPADFFGDAQMVATTDRPFREPGIEFPGMAGLPVWDGNPEIFEIAPDALGLPPEDLYGGQLVTAEGPLGFSFGDYRIAPTSLTPGAKPALPGVRARAAGEFTIATLSARELFDDVDDPMTSDPVLTPLEVETKLAKLSLYILDQLDAPDVLAMQEVENTTILQALADAIFDIDPAVDYTPSLIPGNDFEGSNVAYLTRDDTIAVDAVSQFGDAIIFTFDGTLLYDRPPLVLEATYTGTGGPYSFTAVNVHQRSLSGIDDPFDGERVKNKRLEQAVNLSLFLQDTQTMGGDPLVVLGDFNAYEFTDGYVDVMGQITGDLDPLGDELDTMDFVDPDLTNWTNLAPAEERYTFVFDGNAESLDHIVTSSAMNPAVTGMEYARGNADAPVAQEDDPGTFERSSDHDGLALFVSPGGGGFDFVITGSCPGEVTLTATGGTPGGIAGILFGTGLGSDALAGGPCAGTVTGLANPQLFTTLSLDGSGSFTLTRTVAGGICGTNLQIIDGATCTVSPVDSL